MLCTDADLLRWEPRVAAECADVAQTLFEGAAAFDRESRALVPLGAAGLARAGHIAVVGRECFVIARVDDLAVPATSIVQLAVRTFAAQRRIVADQLARLATPGTAPDALRRAAGLGTLHLIYAALAAAAAPGAEADVVVRAELYLRLYRQSLRGVVRGFDLGDEEDDAPPRGRPRAA